MQLSRKLVLSALAASSLGLLTSCAPQGATDAAGPAPGANTVKVTQPPPPTNKPHPLPHMAGGGGGAPGGGSPGAAGK